MKLLMIFCFIFNPHIVLAQGGDGGGGRVYYDDAPEQNNDQVSLMQAAFNQIPLVRELFNRTQEETKKVEQINSNCREIIQDLYKSGQGHELLKNIFAYNRKNNCFNDLNPTEQSFEVIMEFLPRYCSRDSTNEFYNALIEKLNLESKKIKNNEIYDVIIVGGGVSGTAAALAIGPEFNVLVIDKNDSPSVFGSAGNFFLNNKPSQLRGSKLSPSSFQSETHSTPDASMISKNILVNLYRSGADVRLNSKVLKISEETQSSEEKHKYKVDLEGGQSYFASQIIMATGWQGTNLSFFDIDSQKLLKEELNNKSDLGKVTDTESFLNQSNSNPNFLSTFSQKRVAVVGGGDGGSAVVMNLMQISPKTTKTFEKINKKIKDLQADHSVLPSSVYWVGRKEIVPELQRDKPERFLKDVQNKLGVIKPIENNTDKITKTKMGEYQIHLKNGEVLTVDQIVLATGYTNYITELIEDPNLRKKVAGNYLKDLAPTHKDYLVDEFKADKDNLQNESDSGIHIIGAAVVKNVVRSAVKFIDHNDYDGNLIGSQIRGHLNKTKKNENNSLRKQKKIGDRLQHLNHLFPKESEL